MDKIKLPSSVRVLTIDPGLHGTGWALWPCISSNPNQFTPPSCWGVLQANAANWQDKSLILCSTLAELLKKLNVYQLVIEMPEVWTTGKSHAAATSGDLHKLTYLIGGFSLLAELNENTATRYRPVMISPQQWKGQMSKEAVIRRIQKRCPGILDAIGNHEADAVGMGLALQGVL